MKVSLSLLLLVSFFAIPAASFQGASSAAPLTTPAVNFAGRWQVKFKMAGLEKNLTVVSRAGGAASFLLLDTGLDDKPVAEPQAAAWSQLTNDRVSFSGEAELPIGTCCREIGTLIFKGKFTSNNAMAGKLVFVTSIDEDESPNKLRTIVGTFTAKRIENSPSRSSRQ